MYGHGMNTHLAAGTVNSERDFASVRNENFFEQERLSQHDEGIAEFNRLRVVDEDRFNRGRAAPGSDS